MNRKSLVLLGTCIACILCACNKDDTDEKWAEEEAKLAEYIKINKSGLTLDKGIYFEKLEPYYKDHIQPEAGDYVLVDYVCKFLFEADVVEQVSYKDWQARGAQYPSVYREGGPELWPSELWTGFGIGQLHEDESANVYIPSRLLNLQDFKPRVFRIHLRKVIDTDLKAYQEKLMGCYMSEFGDALDTIIIKDNGKDYLAVYHVQDAGSGETVDASSVKTHTSESYFLQEGDFRTCFNNKEVSWANGSSKFAGLFKTVKKGGKIVVVMPYKLMYGEDSYVDNHKQYIAPPGSVLRYEISIDH